MLPGVDPLYMTLTIVFCVVAILGTIVITRDDDDDDGDGPTGYA